MERLLWSDIDLKENHIEIRAEVSKNSRRRIIDIDANLKSWLRRFIRLGGSIKGDVVPKKNLRNRLRKIRKAASLDTWHQDVMRHSYASYWLAKNTDINKLTLYMGHETTAMLWKHYHKATTKKDADQYWRIKPAPLRRNVVPFSASKKAA